MPSELLIELVGEKEVSLPRFTGYISRALFLHMMRAVDPGEAAELHESDVMKPYSVTQLMFKARLRSPSGYVLDPSYPCRVGFRFLSDKQFQKFMSFFSKKNAVLISEVRFKIASMILKSIEYEELLKSEPVKNFRLIFRTPTYLSSMGSRYESLFPEPLQIFSNLMRIWDSFSDSRVFGEEGLEAYKYWIKNHMGVSAYVLRTGLAEMGKKKAIGFTGWVEYEMDEQEEWNKVTLALAKFAEYSNIGGNRTGGFGEVRFYSSSIEKR
ncbi:CRISPR-associated endoribonuclease Cas6 [Candidatus Bathyarchaeota archaeon]|nr:CRISPR-associated endoribonuclease Cas6 [Candidatus Bathyarchaeota archaeon]